MAVELRSRFILCIDDGRGVLLAHLKDGFHEAVRVHKVELQQTFRHSLVLTVAAAQVLVFLVSWPLRCVVLLELRDVRQGQTDRVRIVWIPV